MVFDHGHALLIGISVYKNLGSSIPQLARDVRALQDVFADPAKCGYPSKQVKALLNKDATHAGILNALTLLAQQTTDEDTVIIYFAGHGGFNQSHEYCLTTVDTTTANGFITSNAVTQTELLEHLRNILAKKLILFINACHSGKISPDLALQNEQDELQLSSFPDSLTDAILETGEGRIIVTACREWEQAYPGDGKLSIFGNALVNGLSGKGAKPGNPGYISAFELYDYIVQAVQKESDRLGLEQTPEFTGLKIIGNLPVALSGAVHHPPIDEQRDQIRCAELVVQFRSALITQNAKDAFHVYRQLEKDDLLVLIADQELTFIHHLLEIIQGNEPNRVLYNTIVQLWPDELAGALCIAAERPGKLKQMLRQILRTFPIDRCSENTQQRIMLTRQHLHANIPPQQRIWPPAAVNSGGSKSIPVLVTHLRNPFPGNHAKNEEDYLFRSRGGLFWREHPVFTLAQSSRKSLFVIYGDNGSGKTALSLALGKYLFSSSMLGVYLEMTPTVEDIMAGIATQLLRFLFDHPTFLAYLTPHVKKLTGTILVTALGRESLKAEIEQHADPTTWNWLQEAVTPRQSSQWKIEATTQLKTLEKNIASSSAVPPREWFQLLKPVCQALKLSSIRLCFDLNGLVVKEWLESTIFQQQALWTYTGIQTILFFTTPVFQNMRSYFDDAAQLSWTPEELDKLFRHRWEAVNQLTQPEIYLPTSDLTAMIERSNGLPGTLAVLWQEYVRKHPK